MSRKKKQLVASIAVIFNENDEVLVALRHQPSLPLAHNKWELPGGGVEFEEDPLYALQREVEEETGLTVRVLEMIPQIFHNVWHHKTYDSQVFLFCYVCRVLGGNLHSCDEEVVEPQWLNPSKVDYMNSLPGTKEIIDLGLEIWKNSKTNILKE
jgi:8-oxo-dGTP diphosphatase